MADRSTDDSSNRGCRQMSIGVAAALVAALAWIGSGINKTDTGLLEPLVAVVGVALLVVGIVRRIIWVRGSD